MMRNAAWIIIICREGDHSKMNLIVFFWIVSEQRIPQLNLNLIVVYTFRHLE